MGDEKAEQKIEKKEIERKKRLFLFGKREIKLICKKTGTYRELKKRILQTYNLTVNEDSYLPKGKLLCLWNAKTIETVHACMSNKQIWLTIGQIPTSLHLLLLKSSMNWGWIDGRIILNVLEVSALALYSRSLISKPAFSSCFIIKQIRERKRWLSFPIF